MNGGHGPTFVMGHARKQAQTNPVWFSEQILQLRQLDGEPSLDENPAASWAMDEWQIELHEAIGDVVRKKRGMPTICNHEGKNFITVRSMHGPGKTLTSAAIVHWFGFAFEQPLIVMTAPKLSQVKTQLMADFARLCGRAIPGYSSLMRVDATKIVWAEDPAWVALAETAKQPENLQGKHRPNLLVVVDEASGVPESLWPVIFAALSTGDILILLIIGNPTRNVGVFADSHLRPGVAEQYYRLHVSLDKTKRVSRSWVSKMVRQYGENSPIVKIRCYGEFAADDKHQLIATSWIANAWMYEFDEDGSLPRLRVSVDVADGGEDETVVTVAKHYESHVRFLKQETFSFSSDKASVDGADEAVRLFEAYGGRKEADDFVVDSVGVGTGVAGVLVSRGYKVVRYKGGSDSDNPKSWRNRRVQSYMILRDAFREGRLSFSDDFTDDPTELQAQLCSIRSKPGVERLEDLYTREEMRAASIKSPDRADSMAMQYATQAPVVPHPPADAPARMKVIRSTLMDGLVV